jgi:GDP-L-fucose synthase
MNPLKDKILITGASGMVGQALREKLGEADNIFYISSKPKDGYIACDLRGEVETRQLFDTYKPDYVFHLAARVGGISANQNYLGDFYEDNIRINTNVLRFSKNYNVKKALSLLSTCVYPNKVDYPLKENSIHDGQPHESNYAYAYAKRMLDVQSRSYREQHGCNFITAIPYNLYGEHDNFHLEDSHVIPAMIRKIYEAKLKGEEVVLWGNGMPLREFTYSKDIADILVFLMDNYDEKNPINIGNTEEISIKKLAHTIASVLHYKQEDVVWDLNKPNGQHRKPSDNSRLLKLGWRKENYTLLENGLERMIEWFLSSYPKVRGCDE